MALSHLPLSYCANVYGGRSLGEVLAGLECHAVAVRGHYGAAGAPLGIGLWLPRAVLNALQATQGRVPGAAAEMPLGDWLAQHHLVCYTLNAFPYGDFHAPVVKRAVYLPDWTDPARLAYTLDCASALAELLPPGVDGSLSSVPISHKALVDPAAGRHADDVVNQAATALIACAVRLHNLYRETGHRVRLALEPEPDGTLETFTEAIAFFETLFARADTDGLEPVVREYIGLCVDVCHHAVNFEDTPAGIAAVCRAGIRINKVHITSAIELDDPANNTAGREQLAWFAEPRYLHQARACHPSGELLGWPDLTAADVLNPPPAWREASRWRVHFHVPVGAPLTHAPDLRTTAHELTPALGAVAQLAYSPHLEVETYTWGVLPPGGGRPLANGQPTDMLGPQRLEGLAPGIAAELVATEALLAGLRQAASGSPK